MLPKIELLRKKRKEASEPDLFKKKIIEAFAELKPNLQADGGDIAFVGLKDGILKVRLEGACATCPMSSMTLKWGIEAIIKERIPEIREVELVR